MLKNYTIFSLFFTVMPIDGSGSFHFSSLPLYLLIPPIFVTFVYPSALSAAAALPLLAPLRQYEYIGVSFSTAQLIGRISADAHK